MTDDLVKRLRDEDPECGLRHSIAMEAADRIEQLEKSLFEITQSVCLVGDWYHVKIAKAALEAGEKKDD